MPAFWKTCLALACSHLHDYLPPPNKGAVTANYDAFVPTLRDAGIGRVAFVRHGNAPAVMDVDFDRQLSNLGKEQAAQAGSSFGKDLRPYFSPVLVSNSPRTIDTAKLFLDSMDCDDHDKNIQARPEALLYDGTMQPGGTALFRKVGYGSLRDYVDNADKDDRNFARSLLGPYAHHVAQLFMKVASTDTTPTKQHRTLPMSPTLLMVGHSLYLQSVCLAVATLAGCDKGSIDLVLDTQTLEAGGFVVDFETKSVSLLKRSNMPNECLF